MRPAAALAALALAALAVLGVAAPASAHDQLLSTSPENGSHVDALPAEVTLTFNDLVTDAGGDANQVHVLDSSCTRLDTGAAKVVDNTITQQVHGQATGPITVLWRAVSRDGHPVSGEFSFTVGDGQAAASPSCAAGDAAPAADAEQGASPLPWVIAGIVLVVVIAGIAHLLITRSRRSADQ
ncbi:copper resistance CopC family protein [Microbacterium luticocti]|uniref:copper resistance CopC family protein n=1 Tax=Microbacterium luticocti TaxID=451764 RepID=UPI0003F77B59|nr:copper resistance CopC family protein [Microbacterium luticocti]